MRKSISSIFYHVISKFFAAFQPGRLIRPAPPRETSRKGPRSIFEHIDIIQIFEHNDISCILQNVFANMFGISCHGMGRYKQSLDGKNTKVCGNPRQKCV